MNIQHQDDGKKGSYFIRENNQLLAEMTYVWSGEKLIIDHTFVDESLKGKGIGKLLLNKVVEFSRIKKIKIIPLCPFAKKMFEKDDSLKDVLF